MTQMIHANETDLLAQIAALQAQLAAVQGTAPADKPKAPRKARKAKLVALGDYATVRVTFADGVVIHTNASHRLESGEVDTTRAVAFAEAVRRGQIAGWRSAAVPSGNWEWVQTEKGMRCRPVAVVPAVESVYVLTAEEQDALRDPTRIERAAAAIVASYAAIKKTLPLAEVLAECERVGMDGLTQWSRHTVRHIAKHAAEQIECRDVKSGRSSYSVWIYAGVEYQRHDEAVAAKHAYIRDKEYPAVLREAAVATAIEEAPCDAGAEVQPAEVPCQAVEATDDAPSAAGGPEELAKVPQGVRSRLIDAVQALQSVAERIATIRVQLGARYVAEAWGRFAEEIDGPQWTIAEFRRCAPMNDVDAESVLAHLGGVPTIERTEEERDYFRPSAVAIPADVLASAERAGLDPAAVGGAFSRLSQRYLKRMMERADQIKKLHDLNIVYEQLLYTVRQGIHPQGRRFTAEEMIVWEDRARQVKNEARESLIQIECWRGREERRANIMGEPKGLHQHHGSNELCSECDYDSDCSRAAEVPPAAEPVQLAARQPRHTYAVHRGDYVLKLCGRDEAARYAARHGGDVLQLPHGWRTMDDPSRLISNALACREGRKQRLSADALSRLREALRATA